MDPRRHRKVAGAPDVLLTNPHYRTAAPMRLYFLDRVKELEVQDPERFQKRLHRRAANKRLRDAIKM